MNIVKAMMAITVLLCAAHVSALPIVVTPDFPVKPPVKTVKIERIVPVCQCPTPEVSVIKKIA